MPTHPPAPVPALPNPARPVAPRALDLVDEAFHRLRLAPLGVLGVYYAGTLPFCLALLYFLADQGHGVEAAGRTVGDALAVTGLFFVMKVCHAVFTAQMAARLRRREGVRWTWTRLRRVFVVQGILQPSGLFALTLASMVVIPFGWVYAFYQNVTVLGDGGVESTRATLSRAWHATGRWPRQNHVGLSILSFLGLFVLLNLLVAMLAIPYLAKMFTGQENMFTRSGINYIFNTTFLAALSTLAYLVLDPIVKTFYTLRCFYEESLHTGEDLLSDLAALPPVGGPEEKSATPAAPACPRPPTGAVASLLAFGLVGAWCLLSPGTLRAEEASNSSSPPAVAVQGGPKRAVSAPELGRSIDDVLNRRRFSWREPRQATQATGPVDSFFKGIEGWLHSRWVSLKKGVEAVRDWFNRVFKRADHPADEPRTSIGAGGNLLQNLLIGLGIILVGLIVYLLAQGRLGRRAPTVSGQVVPTGAAMPPDLTDDTVLATQLPEDEWLRLARSLLEGGERRLALRAFYLSALSALAVRGLLAIARHKSNRDYVAELRRRSRGQTVLPEAFARNVGRFERVWYGDHPLDDSLLTEFQADRERLTGTS